MGNYKYKCIPDLPDQRDFLFQVSAPISLPEICDLRENCTKIQDQGQLGSCTSQAVTEAIEFLQIKNKDNFEDLSRLFVYYNTRSLMGRLYIYYDSGASIRDAVRSVVKYGVCNEDLWKYDINKFKRKPPKVAYSDGLTHKCETYYRLNSIKDIKECLVTGFPVICGFTVYSSFETDEVARTGIVGMPKKNDKKEGGHAILIVGFNDIMINGETKGYFICQNSWGEGWGDKGFFYMPYDYLSMMFDFWTIREEEGY
jgi:C1A family cysteine protease